MKTRIILISLAVTLTSVISSVMATWVPVSWADSRIAAPAKVSPSTNAATADTVVACRDTENTY